MQNALKATVSAFCEFDWLRGAVIVAVVGMLATALAVGKIGYETLASRNLVLACAALIGAMAFFGIQLWLELQPMTLHQTIGVALVVDPNKPGILHVRRSPTVTPGNIWWIGSRASIEQNASRILPPNVLEYERTQRQESYFKMVEALLDFALFSLLGYLVDSQEDWQIQRVAVMGRSSGTSVVQTSPSRRGRVCKEFHQVELRDLLRQAGNMFADADLRVSPNGMCLPPKSAIRVTKDRLVLDTPFVAVGFHFQPYGGAFEQLAAFNVSLEYHRLRSQHHDLGEYRTWADRLVTGARTWFES